MNKKLIASSALFLLLALPTLTFGQTIQDIAFNVVEVVKQVLSIIAGGFVVVMFVLAGFKYLTAQGDAGKVNEANRAVIWGLAGTAVIILAWSAAIIVGNTLGV